MGGNLVNKKVENSVIQRIREGMSVLDADGNRIGKVRAVYYGESTPTENAQGTGAAAVTPLAPANEFLAREITEVFIGDDAIPETLVARLRQEGYIQIDSAGLFKADRYALPDQISGVDEHVHLNVRGKELIHR